jgi:hypothetical protein
MGGSQRRDKSMLHSTIQASCYLSQFTKPVQLNVSTISLTNETYHHDSHLLPRRRRPIILRHKPRILLLRIAPQAVDLFHSGLRSRLQLEVEWQRLRDEQRGICSWLWSCVAFCLQRQAPCDSTTGCGQLSVDELHALANATPVTELVMAAQRVS